MGCKKIPEHKKAILQKVSLYRVRNYVIGG